MIASAALALYLLYLLPATSQLFYELYHWSGVEALYLAYAAAKFGSVELLRWEWRWPAVGCTAATLFALLSLRAARSPRRRVRVESDAHS